ncbi:eukaryotic membrane protein family-domain-containing protein [Pyrenochaeta sp. MPI-SDFR-AT-0127]|nr:eukaryotic membrane protein family-domain-containing protein [Pyrenochaeta sp. MPI-SDFR-AT-0127]
MNGADTRTTGEPNTAEQFSPPYPTPEPDDVAFLSGRRNLEAKIEGPLQNITNIYKAESNGTLSVSSTSRRTSIHEEAILSDTSEKIRPIKRPGDVRRKSSVSDHEKILKLSPRQIQELTSEPTSLPIRAATPILEDALEHETSGVETDGQESNRILGVVLERPVELNGVKNGEQRSKGLKSLESVQETEVVLVKTPATELRHGRPLLNSRSVTTPSLVRRKTSTSRSRSRAHTQTQDGDERKSSRHVPPPLPLEHKDGLSKNMQHDRHKEGRDMRDAVSPVALPLPPLSMPTFLSLELSASRPSPLYIYRPATTDFPYESSQIKYERLLNFLKIPLKIEGILGFGALACLDAWMHVLTILPLRFLLAVAILVKWWGSVIVKEFRDLWAYVYYGLPRLWQRRNQSETPTPLPTPAEEEPPSMSRKPSSSTVQTARQSHPMSTSFKFPDLKDPRPRRTRNSRFRHRRTKSTPSTLLPSHKADILKGLLVISSCFVLMRFDASRMYHGIRGQSAIKLYVIYNVLEVCDRLLSAVGQDVLECLFSRETLDRNPDGRSKVLRPFGMFALALVYTVAHATALFYQVITLNVAVNSYSNALLTLLMSNQFVEIKGTVFKKFEKENLFQITCADVVERFQLWLMLLIIAMRNVVEVGGLSIRSSDTSWTAMFTGGGNATAATAFTATSIIPMSFTIFPKYIAQVLNPFLLVIGSEMFVDWLKHAYITKFNQYKPEVYSKFFDVLAKDYYSNAFIDPNLTRRLGLPVIPLSCLFIRAAIQTYHMFIAMHMPPPLPTMSTSLTSDAESSPATTAALAHIDQVFRRALGRSSFGAGVPSQAWYQLSSWTLDDLIAGSAMLIVFLVGYLIFLAFKLILGMFLLSVSRKRYHGMKEREMMSVETGGKRVGGWGVVDVDEEKRRAIYDDDPESYRRLRERDEKGKRKEEQEKERGTSFGHVSRYTMVAKRIW